MHIKKKKYLLPMKGTVGYRFSEETCKKANWRGEGIRTDWRALGEANMTMADKLGFDGGWTAEGPYRIQSHFKENSVCINILRKRK